MARVVIVTGASAGIGRACADGLHAAGWTVIGASRRGTASAGWLPIVMDVDRDDSVATGVSSVLEEQGRIDAVVANAGWGLAGPVEGAGLGEAKSQMETNFWGAARLVKAALPAMRSQGWGRIVLVSSIGGIIGLPFQAFYSASKFAMEGYGEALAYEVEPFGVSVTLVEPGNVRTDFTGARRTAAGPASGDPYSTALKRALSKMESDEASGVNPSVVASAVERVLAAGRPPRRVAVGKLEERVGVLGRRLLPYRVFERLARGSLGV